MKNSKNSLDFLAELGIQTAQTSANNAAPDVDPETAKIIFEVLQATGLNWQVSKEPAKFTGPDGKDILVPNKFVSVRKNPDGTVIPFDVVGKDYTVLQNAETVELVYRAGAEVFDQSADVVHPWNNVGKTGSLGSFGNMAGGSLLSGSAVFVQLELPTAYVGKSDVKRFITITNKHDGSASLGFGSTSQVVCCANTFAIANRQLDKIRHTLSMKEKVQLAVQELRRALEFEEKQIEIFARASKIGANEKHFDQMISAIFGTSLADLKKDSKQEGSPSTRTRNQIEDFVADYRTSIEEQGNNVWALFNGVTRYTNHTRTVKDKDYSLIFGGDAQINAKAYRVLESIVS